MLVIVGMVVSADFFRLLRLRLWFQGAAELMSVFFLTIVVDLLL